MPRLCGSKRLPDDLYNRRWLLRVQQQIKVDANGCWLWQGFVHKNGYGSCGYRDHNPRIHRKVYELTKEPIPPGLDVCHTCDVRNCINPDHLWAGTRQQNTIDAGRKKKLYHARKTHCDHGHEFSPENTRPKKIPGRPDLIGRTCIACERIVQRLRAGWSREDAESLPPTRPGQKTARRSIGVKREAA